MGLVGVLIVLCIWGIKSELSDINSSLRDIDSSLKEINDSLYENEDEEDEEEIPENNLVEFVGEDENGNGIYKFK